MPADQIEITYLGHSSFRLARADGPVVLIDPWLAENPMCPEALKGLDRADLGLVTHGHTDHLDRDIIDLLRRTGATMVAPASVLEPLEIEAPDLKFEDMGKGGNLDLRGVRITMTDAVHSAWMQGPDGRMTQPHETAGFVVHFGDVAIYHAGDTAVFSDMALIGRLYRPRVALLPIGDRYTMGPREAAVAAELVGAPVVVPMHFATFPILTGTPEAFEAALALVKGVRMREMRPGETATVAAL